MELKSLLKRVNWLLGAIIFVLGLTVVIGASLIGLKFDVKSKISHAGLSQGELIKRGAYLVNTSACHDCHSPKVMTPFGPEPDPDRLLSGYPADMPISEFETETLKNWVLFNQELTSAVGPWGISFAANITSDETGIGNWTEEQFFRAIREGKYKGLEGSRSLLPPMPWQVYRNMTDDDIRSIFAYLKSTVPIANIVPQPISPDQILNQ